MYPIVRHQYFETSAEKRSETKVEDQHGESNMGSKLQDRLRVDANAELYYASWSDVRFDMRSSLSPLCTSMSMP